ncbi:TPA: hypothetical protein ACXZLZ_004148 [Salmonella enterica]
MRYIYFVFFCWLWSPVCSSAIFSHIISAESGPIPNRIYYYFSIDSWTDDPTPNPCYGESTCAIAIDHRHTDAGNNGKHSVLAGWESTGLPCITKSITMTDLRECMWGKPATYSDIGLDPGSGIGTRFTLPFLGEEGHSGMTITQECVGLFWGTSFDGESMRLLPNSVCGIAPPPIGSCGMPGSIEIDHGSLPASSVDGNIASTTFPVDCNKAITIKLYMRGLENNRLPLDSGSGIYSQLILNDNPISEQGVALNLLQGENILRLNSRLISDGKVSSGKHQGQGILIMSFE